MSEKKPSVSAIKTVGTFLCGRACSDTLLHMLNSAYGNQSAEEERAAQLLAGGIMQHGYQCGMIWGAALAAGAQAYRLFGSAPQAEARAVLAAQKLVGSFRTLNEHTNCVEITEIDKSSTTAQMIYYFLIRGGTIGCLRMAAKYAPAALGVVHSALYEAQVEAPAAPVSCAAELARRMGASERHAVMAAGLAGGIGLSGGACGALGAAIWFISLKNLKEGDGKISLKSSDALSAINRFMQHTNYEFECSKIVGRKFADIGDHARHICAGGCSKIIEALAAE